MEFFFDSLKEAFLLIVRLNPDILYISWTSLWITSVSCLLATLFGLSVALIIASNQFKGKRILITILNTLMALPTVVVGLLVYSFLSRKGLFGAWDILYTPYAMIIGQFILATPIITAITISTLEGANEKIQKTALTLGATKFQAVLTMAKELHIMILAAVVAGFGKIFSEVGVSMILGGNIRNYTRNITTSIAFETSKGEFSLALALGLILLIIAFGINLLFQQLVKIKKNEIL